MKNKILYWFYSTWLGGKYLEFLLWKDGQNEKVEMTNSKQVNEIVIQAQQLLYKEGIANIKKKVNSIVNSGTKEEYDQKLKGLEDLMPLAERDDEKLKQVKQALFQAYVVKDKDIKNSTDFAKMIDQKIEDTKKLWAHKEKRDILRKIRKLKTSGEMEQAAQLEQEFFNRYGR